MLNQPLTLPCGAVVPNRICKAAMTEGLAHPDGSASAELARLYGLWSDGGSGILLSGNIQVDGDHLERPGNVIVDGPLSEDQFQALSTMAKEGTRAGNHLWAQISHAGRQTQKIVNPSPKAPSAVRLRLPQSQFGEPVALTHEEIETLIDRFVNCAVACVSRRALPEFNFTLRTATSYRSFSAHSLINERISGVAYSRIVRELC